MFPKPTRRARRRLTALATGVALAAGALTVSATGSASAAGTWAEPGSVTVQTYTMAVEVETAQGFDEVVSLDSDIAEYRQLLDIGHISGGSGDDLLGITASGRLRLFPSTYSQPSTSYLSLGGGWQTYNQVTVVGDLSGDGRADLMARDTHGRLWYYASQNSLSRPFRQRVQVGTNWNIYDQLIGAAGFHGSARACLLARDLQGRLWLYDGNADGTLSGRRQIGTGWKVYNQLLGLDWNGDGRGDIIGRTESGTLYAYDADGAGGYASRVQVATGLASYNAIANEGHQPDFGKGQIVGRTAGGELYVYTGRENGTLFPGGDFGSGFTPSYYPLLTYTVAATDDGQSGMLASNNYNELTNMGASASETIPNGHYTAAAGPGDLNGDGHGDVVARDTHGELWFMARGASGGFIGKPVLIGGGWNIYNRIVGAGDLTGDGIADIVATTSNGAMYLYPGLGNAKFGGRIPLGYGWQGYTKLAAPGDLTGDGKSDLAAVDTAGRLWLYPGLGNGRFGARTEIGTGGWNGYHDIS